MCENSSWMSIETAPKDGTVVRLLCENGEDTGFYSDYSNRVPPVVNPFTGKEMKGEWSTILGNGEPSHWKPFFSESFFGGQDD